ncbi:uncharacterized protein LOC115441439 [Manduca sexta]|uniref:uncharacterized protein LOC115441439 n=1 Tax=Manduca sexta TaxID=7130 RepID=UPI00188E101A|nr:uncharacterized protein LOC115441439 [Manduca sexta]
MIRKSIISKTTISWVTKDKKKCGWIAKAVYVQCILVYIGSASILNCMWSPDYATMDFDKLARIMYLFDSQACGYKVQVAKTVGNLKFSNNTRGLKIYPIQWKPALVTVSTRLSAKTRIYIEMSLSLHIIWMMITFVFHFFTNNSTKIRFTKISLAVFFYASVFVIIFDLSMAIVYVSHIKQSLTKGMVLRYSGWSVQLRLAAYDDFAGWLPIGASICWMRGIFLLGLNIYICKIIYFIRKKIKKKEVGKRTKFDSNPPIPEPKSYPPDDKNILYFRSGESTPYIKKDIRKDFVHRVFY